MGSHSKRTNCTAVSGRNVRRCIPPCCWRKRRVGAQPAIMRAMCSASALPRGLLYSSRSGLFTLSDARPSGR